METNANTYSNKEITITYDPKMLYSQWEMRERLSAVFRTSVIPWVDPDAADSSKIIAQIRKCPSGALKYVRHKKRCCLVEISLWLGLSRGPKFKGMGGCS